MVIRVRGLKDMNSKNKTACKSAGIKNMSLYVSIYWWGVYRGARVYGKMKKYDFHEEFCPNRSFVQPL